MYAVGCYQSIWWTSVRPTFQEYILQSFVIEIVCRILKCVSRCSSHWGKSLLVVWVKRWLWLSSCDVSVGAKEFRSKTVKNTTSPLWNEHFEVFVCRLTCPQAGCPRVVHLTYKLGGGQDLSTLWCHVDRDWRAITTDGEVHSDFIHWCAGYRALFFLLRYISETVDIETWFVQLM